MFSKSTISNRKGNLACVLNFKLRHMGPVEILILIISILFLMLILNAVLRVLVVPRGEKLVMTKVFLWFLLGLSRALTRFVKNFKTRDEIYARVGPAALLALPIFWIVGVVFSFSGIFWALGTRPYLEALELSGSSLTTLGFLISDDGQIGRAHV